MVKWKCEPCGHETREKPWGTCLICRTPLTAVKIVSDEEGIKRITRIRG